MSSSPASPTFPILYTERLELRMFDPSRPSDYKAILTIYESDFILRTVGDPGVHTREDLDLRSQKFHLRPRTSDNDGDEDDADSSTKPLPSHPWHLIYLRGTDTLVGTVSLFHRHPLPYPDMGYAVLEPYMGRGFATEAARAALRWWTDDMGVPNIWAAVFDTNAASHRVAQKIGFVHGGMVTTLLRDGRVMQSIAFVQPDMGRCLDGLTVDLRP
ncbi:hypothetical protein AYL99_03015 [Fonsecaea erecta]|uniref:N-acetyltransferase domain-containing protein n=1 Tax=Fonsecaea erecta TaxID=1367422 RepID=A0A178ZVH1_9EURO|nr:hypothetical protein AYL99_03015 [Fonsecaea erecta]OAP63788.1 hypothetical protein AYL99_03015 [Fonsecaea erecta]